MGVKTEIPKSGVIKKARGVPRASYKEKILKSYASATTDTNDLSALPFLKATTPLVRAKRV